MNMHCQFPFSYRGKQYSTCALEHSSGKYWCATLVNPETNEIIEGKRGYCDAGCPKEGDSKGLRKLDCKDTISLCHLLKPHCGQEDVKNSCRKTCNACIGQGRHKHFPYLIFSIFHTSIFKHLYSFYNRCIVILL